MKEGRSRFCSLFPFAEKLFEKENGKPVNIPFGELTPLFQSPKDDHIKITRRMFRQYLKDKLGRKDVDRRIDDEPSILNQLCDFETDYQKRIVKVTKKRNLQWLPLRV